MLYQVKKQYARGSATPTAEFNDLNDAKLFIEARLREDARLKVKVVYILMEGIDVLGEFSESNDAGGGLGQSSGQRFQPTPFNAAPRPAGMPSNWLKDEEDKKK